MQENILDQITPEAKAEMETIWFTADHHHGHNRIVKFCERPVKEEDHDEWLINETWNKYIGKKDRVYHLGDLSMAKRKDAEKFIQKLNGQKYLILGNHDKNIHNSPHFVQVTQIKEFSYYRFGLDINIVLCHYPMMSWNRSVHGAWHLYGHVHGRTKHPGLAMDVGIDNDDFEGYRPLNLYQICEFMSKKSQVNLDK
jgi:calcineurin-like phosphoesterase family protein